MQTDIELINTEVYAGRLKDKKDLNNSSSGGAFTALSDFFLKNGNAVVAVVYNYATHTAEFQMILDEKQRERAKGSKYMQSKPGDIYLPGSLSLANGKSEERTTLCWYGMSIRWISKVQ